MRNVFAGAAILLMLSASFAHAGVSVRGMADSVRIEAQNASIEEVLQTLRDSYALTYTSKVPLQKQVSGVYEGPLSRVVGLLLKDMNFVLTHGQTLHVAITTAAGRPEKTVTAMPPPEAASKADAAAQTAAEILKLFSPPPSTPIPSPRK